MNALLVLVALLLGYGVLAIRNVTIDDKDPSIVYSGNWVPDSELTNGLACGGSHRYSNDSSATATWQFTGVAFYYMAPQWAYPVNTIINIDNHNITANIDLDNHALPQTAPGLAESTRCSVLWGSGNLENGLHTVVASMPPGGPPFVVVDAFMYTVLDPTDLPPVATTTTATSATIITSTPTGSFSTPASLDSKKSKGVSIPMVVGIAVAIGVVATAIIFLLCLRIRRAAQISGVNEEPETRFYSPGTPLRFQPEPVQIVNTVPEPASPHFWRNHGSPPRPIRELIDNEPVWLSRSVSDRSSLTGSNQMPFDTSQTALEAHRPAFSTPTTHSLESVHAANGVGAEIWAMPRNVTFTHTSGIQMADKQPRMEETSLNGTRTELRSQVTRLHGITESQGEGAPPQYDA